MRILLGHYLQEKSHPAVQALESLAIGLRNKGHEALVYGPEVQTKTVSGVGSSKPKRPSLFRKFGFLRELGRDWKRLISDREILKTYRPHVVVVRQDAYRGSLGKAAQELNVPQVLFADAPVAWETRKFDRKGRWHPQGLLEATEARGLRRAGRVVTVSHPAAKLLGQYANIPPVEVIPNGVHSQRFTTQAREMGRHLRETLVPSGKTVVGFAGSFRVFHGTDLLLEMMRRTKGDARIHWLLVGDGPEWAGVASAVKNEGLSATLTGWVEQGKMTEYMGAMDVLVAPHPILGEEFYFSPLKILEAAAAGCALLATKQGDIPSYLSPDQTHYLLDTDCPTQWVETLRQLCETPGEVVRLGNLNRDRALSNFTWENSAEKWEKVLEGVVATH